MGRVPVVWVNSRYANSGDNVNSIWRREGDMDRRKGYKEVQRENPGKPLRRIKTELEDKRELWLEAYTEFIPLCKREDSKLMEEDIERASDLADHYLEIYEKRWGE